MLATEGELCVCELTAALNEVQPKVSRHLGVLKDTGLAVVRREGTWMFYRLDALPAGAVQEETADLKRLKAMSGRPERCAS